MTLIDHVFSVHGQLRFSAMEMEAPPNAEKTGGRLTGEVMSNYLESFTKKFLSDRILYGTEVVNIRRPEKESKDGWVVTVKTLNTGTSSELYFNKIVLCTGVRVDGVWVRLHTDRCLSRAVAILVFLPISLRKQPWLPDFAVLLSILVNSARSYQTSSTSSNQPLLDRTRIQEG
jgi:hypothetical protein